jgi:ABC-type branched-subunit amino acid transport system substrate-binding protein
MKRFTQHAKKPTAGILTLFSMLLSFITPIWADQAENPVPHHSKVIHLGMSTALTGPASFLGINTRSGVLAAIEELNRQDGISGVRVELICLDDGYEPTLTAPNMRRLISQEDVLADIILATPAPKAVIMVGTYVPCAEFIRLAKANGVNPLFLNVSFVGAKPLAADLGPAGDGVIVTQVMPHFDADLPVVADFREALAAHDPSLVPSFVSLEGYIAARILFKALARIPGQMTREAVVDTLENMGSFDIGLDEPLMLGPHNHQASHRVWPTVLKNGRAVPFRWENLPAGRESAQS